MLFWSLACSPPPLSPLLREALLLTEIIHLPQNMARTENADLKANMAPKANAALMQNVVLTANVATMQNVVPKANVVLTANMARTENVARMADTARTENAARTAEDKCHKKEREIPALFYSAFGRESLSQHPAKQQSHLPQLYPASQQAHNDSGNTTSLANTTRFSIQNPHTRLVLHAFLVRTRLLRIVRRQQQTNQSQNYPHQP